MVILFCWVLVEKGKGKEGQGKKNTAQEKDDLQSRNPSIKGEGGKKTFVLEFIRAERE